MAAADFSFFSVFSPSFFLISLAKKGLLGLTADEDLGGALGCGDGDESEEDEAKGDEEEAADEAFAEAADSRRGRRHNAGEWGRGHGRGRPMYAAAAAAATAKRRRAP